VNLVRADKLVQRGRGLVGRYVGQSFNGYRLTNQTGQLVQGAPTVSNFRAKMTHYTGSAEIENANFGVETFQAVGDDRKLEIGDVMVGFGYGNDTSYCVAGMRPLKHLIFVRVEQNCSLTKPYDVASAADQMPSGSATVYTSIYAAQGQFKEIPLVLNSGIYSWSESGGTAAMVPVGLQPHNRLREFPKTDLPTELRREFFVAFVPLLNGVQIVENVVINCGNGDRYKVMQVYIGQFGLVGHNLILQKLEV
jgi:hypothetical protein